MFCPFVSSPHWTYSTFPQRFLLIQIKANTHYPFERAVLVARLDGPFRRQSKFFILTPVGRAVLASKCRIQSICLPILADRTVALMLQCCIRLSVVCLSMTLRIVVKRSVLEQKVNWQHIHQNIQSIYRASQKSNPPGKILYLWNCSRYIYQMCRVYRWGFSPHILQILLKWQMRFNRYNSLNFKVHFFHAVASWIFIKSYLIRNQTLHNFFVNTSNTSVWMSAALSVFKLSNPTDWDLAT